MKKTGGHQLSVTDLEGGIVAHILRLVCKGRTLKDVKLNTTLHTTFIILHNPWSISFQIYWHWRDRSYPFSEAVTLHVMYSVWELVTIWYKLLNSRRSYWLIRAPAQFISAYIPTAKWASWRNFMNCVLKAMSEIKFSSKRQIMKLTSNGSSTAK